MWHTRALLKFSNKALFVPKFTKKWEIWSIFSSLKQRKTKKSCWKIVLILLFDHCIFKRYQKVPSWINLRVWPKGFCHPLRPLCYVASFQILEITNRRRVLLLSRNLALYLLVNIKYEKNFYAILKVYYQWTFIANFFGIVPSSVKSTEHSYIGISYRSFWDTLYYSRVCSKRFPSGQSFQFCIL